jgi:hypothetical protein
MAYIFDKILLKGIRSGQVPARTKKARDWFRDTARGASVSATSLTKDKDRASKGVGIGNMYMFFYDPKGKKTLPYYDRFPLVFVIEKYSDGFLGINLHYLPYKLRAQLMDALYTISTNKKYDDTTRLRVSYQVLKSAAKFGPFKPCIKRYLTGHAKSSYMKVDSTEWDIALFLPVEQFKKASASEVWSESQKAI